MFRDIGVKGMASPNFPTDTVPEKVNYILVLTQIETKIKYRK